MTLTRRKFIQIGGAAAGGAALASGLTTRWWGLDADHVEDPRTEGDVAHEQQVDQPHQHFLPPLPGGRATHVHDGARWVEPGLPARLAHPIAEIDLFEVHEI